MQEVLPPRKILDAPLDVIQTLQNLMLMPSNFMAWNSDPQLREGWTDEIFKDAESKKQL